MYSPKLTLLAMWCLLTTVSLADFPWPSITLDPTKLKLPPWELKFNTRYKKFYFNVICVDTDSKCDVIGCYKGRTGCDLTYSTSTSGTGIGDENLWITRAASRAFVYDGTQHELLAFQAKSFGITCPVNGHCVLKTTGHNKFTIMSWALVGKGTGNSAKVDKFTMCMEKYQGDDVRRLYYDVYKTGCVKVEVHWSDGGSLPANW